MCGRYRLSKRKQLIEEYFETANEVDWEPRYNIAPSQNAGIISQDPSRPRREFSQVRWGLIPYWAKDDQCPFRDGRQQTGFPRSLQKSPVPRTGRRIL